MRTLGLVLSVSVVACASGPAAPAAKDPPPVSTSAPAPDASALAPAEVASAAPVAPASVSTAEAPPAKAPAEPLPAGLKVLVIGDSFAEALGVGLKAKEKDTGIKVTLKGEKATFIPEWAGPNKGVAVLVKQYQPDLVVIALGGNELAMTTPEIRAPKVAKLVGLLGETPCVWVSPPLWGNKDNGLLGIIRDNSKPCRHFDSNVLAPDLPRGSDKIHPTAEGQKKWATHLLDWLAVERDASAGKFTLRPRPASE
jgi:lysophospholipase L1-like esterase